ncbi:MAG: hypothetical protein ACLFR1_06765 [Spirochaetia bacterium]
MKRILSLLIIMLLFSTTALIADEEQPQLAYRFLMEYIHDEEEEAGNPKTAGLITIGVGAGLTGLGVAAYFYADDVSSTVFDEPMDDSMRYIISGSIAGSGILTMTIGLGIYATEPRDVRSEFTTVLEEEDPAVQEALAASALHDLAEESKRQRLISGWSELAIPLITAGSRVTANIIQERPWHEDVVSITSWQAWQIWSGISQVFFERTEEERVYEQYLSAREALY